MPGKYIDTHAHLYLEEFDNDRDMVMENALQSGIARILLPNIDSSSIEAMNRMSSRYADVCFSMMGLHPTSVKENYREELQRVVSELELGNYVGVGEIGIDLYWDKSRFREQCIAFEAQLELSLHHHLPVVIHARESFTEILEILEKYRNKGLKGVFHAFTGDIETAEKVTDLGFLLGIGGILTYKNSLLPQVIRHFDLKHMVLETDSPYLSPVPMRGKRNESSYIPYIAAIIQQIKSVPLTQIADITTGNALRLFFANHISNDDH